ncbi:MAG TPA: autotransporter domain-containing protein [Tardiphaga sp.]
MKWRLLVSVAPLASLALATPALAEITNYGLLADINSGPGQVAIFDTQTNTTIGSPITTGNYPGGSVFSADGRLAYLTNAGGNSISVIDVVARTVVATIAVGLRPYGVTLSPDGQFLYVTNYNSGTVSVIATATNTIVGSPITLASGALGIAASHDGGTLYVSNQSAGTVSIIDVATRTVVGTVAVGNSPSDVVVSPDGSKVYVVGTGSNSVSVIDTATQTVTAAITVGALPWSVVVTPDGSKAYVVNEGVNNVSVIDTTTNTVVGTIAVPGLGVAIAITPDGSRVYVTTVGVGTVSIIDTATNAVIGSFGTALGNQNLFNGWIGPNIIVSSGGPLTVANDAALTTLGFGQYVDFNGGTLKLTGTFNSARTFSLLTLGGIVDTNGFDATISGAIINNGSLTKEGLGTLTLTGANTYTGGTLVTGGLINFSAANNFGTGLITLDGGGLQWATGNTTDISSRLAAFGSNGATFDTNGNNVTLASALTGTGSLTKIGAGSLVLSTIEAYTGATIIAGGTLALSGIGSIAASSGVSVGAGATLDISGTSAGATIATLAGVAGATVILGGQTLTLANASTTFGGLITGTGRLTLAGGTETLTGPASYTGGTTVQAGTLVLGNAGALGTGSLALAAGTTLGFIGGNYMIANNISISGDPTFAPAASTIQTLSGVISDGGSAGTLEMIGPGSLVLTGTNTYTGATIVAGGTLALSGTGSIAASSGVNIGSGATFDISATSAGATIATLDGVAGGTVALGSQTLTLSNASTTFGGVIAGSGGLTQAAGQETLTGANTYTGATTINGGTLFIGGSIAGSPTTVGSGGTLSGTGTVGNVTVAGGGMLAPGSGVAGTTLNVAGNLAFQSGALYQVQVNPLTASSTIVSGSTALAGTVQAFFAAGSYVGKNYTIVTAASRSGSFEGLTTSGLPTGFSASLDYSTPNSVTLDLQAGLQQVGDLAGNRKNVAGALDSYFNNGGALPPGFVALFGLTGSNLATALGQLSGEPATGGQQGAFQMTSGFLGLMTDPFVDGRGGAAGSGALGFAPERAALPPDIASAYAAVTKAPSPTAPSFEPRWSLWGSAYGGSNRTSGDIAVGSSDLSARTGGFAAGADYQLSPSTVVGFALAGGQSSWSLAQGLGGGRSDSFQAGIHGRTTSGPAYLAASFAFANHWMSTDRTSFASDRLTASFNAQSYGGRLEAGYRIASSFAAVTPYAAVNAQLFDTPSYRENDLTGGGFGLSYAGRSATDTRGEAGARFDRSVAINASSRLTLRAKLAYAHDWVSDPSLTATFQALPGASFVVSGGAAPRDSALASVGAEWRFANGFALGVKFDGEFASRSQTYAGTGTVRYAW